MIKPLNQEGAAASGLTIQRFESREGGAAQESYTCRYTTVESGMHVHGGGRTQFTGPQTMSC